MKTLDISNVSFSYGADSERRAIFDKGSLSIEDSRIVGLVGVNGSGKSTLLRLIKGDLKPQGGTIHICGKSIYSLSNISFITQQAIDNIFPKLTVFENYMFFHERRSFSLDRFDKEINRIDCQVKMKAAGMNLESRLDEQVRFLSGGQQQALGIILACDMESPVLLMDEPTASLDVFVSEKILKLATDEVLKKNGFLIFTSHNLYDILKYTNTIVVLNNGGRMASLDNSHKDLSIDELRKLMQA